MRVGSSPTVGTKTNNVKLKKKERKQIMLEITVRPMIKNVMLNERCHETFDDMQIQHMLDFVERLRSAKYSDGTRVYSGVSIYTSRLEDKRETHEHFVHEF